MAGRKLTLRGALAELAEEFTSIEHSKVARTLTALLFRPGLLTREYFSARRVRYIKPLTLCLTVLALNFFVYSAGSSVSFFDVGKTTARSDALLKARGIEVRDPLSARIQRAAARKQIPVAVLEEQIDDLWARNLSFLQIPLIVMFTGVLALAYRRSGRFAAEHWIFSMHFISFQSLFVALTWPLYYLAGLELTGISAIIGAGSTIVAVAYLFAAIRRFYGDRLKQALIRAPLLYLGYFVVFSLAYQVAMMLALRTSLAG